MSTDDIFDFWQHAAPDARRHPRDEDVLRRASNHFNLDCLPAPFYGPLRTARVVLLYLSPGFDPSDVEEAKTETGHERYREMRTGTQPLPGPTESAPTWKWWSSRTRAFGDWAGLRDKVAILNIGAYHSKTFDDAPMLASLPSSRKALDWAQTVLFPEAEAGRRVVLCMRAARTWGLDSAARHGKSLLAPKVTIGGHLVKDAGYAGAMAAVRQALDIPS